MLSRQSDAVSTSLITTQRSKAVTNDIEHRDAVGSKISERDSFLYFIHRGTQYDSFTSQPVAHKHTSNFFVAIFISSLTLQRFYCTVCSAGANYVISCFIIVLLLLMP